MRLSGHSGQQFKTHDSLLSENQHLRELVVSLSATVLRRTALEFCENPNAYSADPQHLLSAAEECFRCARLPGLKSEIVEGLEAAGHQYMARAVETETTLQREKWKNGVGPS